MAAKPHPEDIKAELRKRYGSIAEFERKTSLPARSVKDVLRGRSRPTIAQAVAKGIDRSVHELFPDRFSESPSGDAMAKRVRSHRLNCAAE